MHISSVVLISRGPALLHRRGWVLEQAHAVTQLAQGVRAVVKGVLRAGV